VLSKKNTIIKPAILLEKNKIGRLEKEIVKNTKIIEDYNNLLLDTTGLEVGLCVIEGKESIKLEEPKVEEPVVEEPKQEEPVVEEPKQEEPPVEEPKQEEPPVEEPKQEEPPVEEPKQEEPPVENPDNE